jgi:uncharacterized protein (TIGR03083 family)
MSANGVQLDATVRIPVLDAFRVVNGALLELLGSFGAEDWHRATVHKDRSVKDLAAHLLHGSMRRVTGLRDQYRPPVGKKFSTTEELTQFIQDDNRAFMEGMARVSPQIIIELIARYDPEVLRLFESLDPAAPGLGVAWAGEWISQNWFDVAREYTEKWHHQQQLRDATGRPALYDPMLLAPALETFARGVPFAYRSLEAAGGTSISILVKDLAGVAWTLRRERDAWSLWSGAVANPETAISASADTFWRVWTKGVSPATALESFEITGKRNNAQPLARFVATMA